MERPLLNPFTRGNPFTGKHSFNYNSSIWHFHDDNLKGKTRQNSRLHNLHNHTIIENPFHRKHLLLAKDQSEINRTIQQWRYRNQTLGSKPLIDPYESRYSFKASESRQYSQRKSTQRISQSRKSNEKKENQKKQTERKFLDRGSYDRDRVSFQRPSEERRISQKESPNFSESPKDLLHSRRYSETADQQSKQIIVRGKRFILAQVIYQ